jgi:hypothetical protein
MLMSPTENEQFFEIVTVANARNIHIDILH